MEETTRRHQTLLGRVPAVQDVQSAWSLLLHCAGSRANYLLSVVRPDLVRSFAERHNGGLWQRLARILGRSSEWDITTQEVASLPLSLGGLGLRNAVRTSPSAHWASWSDSLPMIKARHPEVADSILHLMHQDGPPSLMAASRVAVELRGVSGFDPPSWHNLANGARPPFHDLDDQEPGVVRHGWQHEAASRVERDVRERRLMPRLADHERALLRSQSGPFAGLAFCVAPASFLTRIDSHLFRVLLLRRLRLPLPLSVRTCRCGRLLDPFGHHRASCSRAGVFSEETCRAVLVVSMGFSSRVCGSPSFRRVLVGCACLRKSRWFGAQLS